MIRAALLATAALVCSPSWADGGGDGSEWLNRMMTAAQQLSYSGTFVYQSGGQSETSRVVRIVDEQGERERLEVLDGSPREVVRINDEVRCYLPADRRVVIERRASRRAFPALFSRISKGIQDHYTVRVGEGERIAGIEARQLVLEPRDSLRYGYQLWADAESGLLLKARTVDEKNQMVEQFAFTQVVVGSSAETGDTVSKLQGQSSGWRVESLDVPQESRGESPWRLRQPVPGFGKISESVRRLQDDGGEIRHIVFSDGIAAVSLFVGPASRASAAKPSAVRQGAINIYSRRVGASAVTVLGEVPMVTVRRFAEAMELRQP